MSKVITTKKINIDQLGYETLIDLNIISEPTGETIISSSVAQKELEAFINAHNADDNWVNPNLVIIKAEAADAKLAAEAKLLALGLTADDLKALGL